MRATIVGAGVTGLTTAVVFLEAGWDVEVIARDTHESTVSMVAAAVWTVIDAEPEEATRRWALHSRTRFATAAGVQRSGVVALRQRELARIDNGPSWWESQPFVRRLGPDELPNDYATGLDIDGFLIEPPVYLPWLSGQVGELGGKITVGEVDRLDALDGDVVANCSGLGAAGLAADGSVYPIRGQVVAIANPGIDEGVSDESDLDRIAYVYPRSREVILGGLRQPGSWDLSPDTAVTERILADCARLDPSIEGLGPLDVRVGLRPGRPTVRVEAQLDSSGRPIVHNYGHGGAGYILSWGAALEAVAHAASSVEP